MDQVVEEVEKIKEDFQETYAQTRKHIYSIQEYGKTSRIAEPDNIEEAGSKYSLPRTNGLVQDGLKMLQSLQFRLDLLAPQIPSVDDAEKAQSLAQSWQNQIRSLRMDLKNANLQAKANMKKAAQQEVKSAHIHIYRERSLTDDYESLIATTDAELLKRSWRNEKASPEILKFEAALIHRSREQIQLLEDTVEDFNKNGVDSLTVSLYQMDLDRTMFMFRSYLRTRLQKIEKYVFHIQKTTELLNRLSKQEQEFAERYAGDLKLHLENSVLSKLPNQYQSHLKQSSASEEDDMVPKPKLDTYVVCRSKKVLGAILLDDSGEEPINIEADDLYALPYTSITSLVENGQIDLV